MRTIHRKVIGTIFLAIVVVLLSSVPLLQPKLTQQGSRRDFRLGHTQKKVNTKASPWKR